MKQPVAVLFPWVNVLLDCWISGNGKYDRNLEVLSATYPCSPIHAPQILGLLSANQVDVTLDSAAFVLVVDSMERKASHIEFEGRIFPAGTIIPVAPTGGPIDSSLFEP